MIRIILVLFVCFIGLKAEDLNHFDKKKYCKCDAKEHFVRTTWQPIPENKFRFLAIAFALQEYYDVKSGEQVYKDLPQVCVKLCYATVINPRFLLTSFSCLASWRHSDDSTGIRLKHYVAAGWDKNLTNILSDSHFVRSIIEVTQLTKGYDVALLELEGAGFEFGEESNVYPACFVNRRVDFVSRPQFMQIGYQSFKPWIPHPMKNRFKRSYKLKLQYPSWIQPFPTAIMVSTVNSELCNKVKKNLTRHGVHQVPESAICTGVFNARASHCPEEYTSGPLIAWVDSAFFAIIGITTNIENASAETICNVNVLLNYDGTDVSKSPEGKKPAKPILLDKIREKLNDNVCIYDADTKKLAE